MGYTLDSRGKPTFTPSPTQTVADLTAAVEYADKVGGLLRMSSSDRELLTSDDVLPGWVISEIDTGNLFQVTASSPMGVPLVTKDTGDVAISLNGGWTNGASPASYRVKGGMASLNGRISAATGASTVAFVLPPVARPSSERVTSVMLATGNDYQTLIIGSGGGVTFFNLVLPAADYRLASIPPWPVA
jgi:hypothetical protein